MSRYSLCLLGRERGLVRTPDVDNFGVCVLGVKLSQVFRVIKASLHIQGLVRRDGFDHMNRA